MFDYGDGDGEQGEERWDWWFELDRERTVEELDEWERKELARK